MAQWSNVWTDKNIPANGRFFVLLDKRFTEPSKPKKRTGGQYPHKQPFFMYRKGEKKAV